MVLGLIPAGAGNTPAVVKFALAGRAHPRRRGEHSPASSARPWCLGSSPQARGTRLHRLHPPRRNRLIPAGAGNTLVAVGLWLARTAHPRRRGEHTARGVPAAWATGSSPQARGTLAERPRPATPPGLIPAGAGNTRANRDEDNHQRAHPRRRGEHQTRQQHRRNTMGSSPQARGTRLHCVLHRGWWGLIPAGAGNTPASGLTGRKLRAHPRRRGEHLALHLVFYVTRGSSPQARGTRNELVAEDTAHGLIPAGAGNTSPPQARCTKSWGSSPQARGTHRGGGERGSCAGLIPAGAGNTSWCVLNHSLAWAHPRRRGEHDQIYKAASQGKGSSPQARGTPVHAPRFSCAGRLIPAGAGNTSSCDSA